MKDSYGGTALFYAVLMSTRDTVDMILPSVSSEEKLHLLQMKDLQGDTILHLTTNKSDAESAEIV